MKITIELDKEDKLVLTTEPSEEGENLTYDTLLAVMLASIQHSTETILKSNKMTPDEKQGFAVRLEDNFARCFFKIFPEYAPNEDDPIDLCDAAIIKAQDDIINDAYKRGITYKEALKEYNDKAKEYVSDKKAQELIQDARKMS